MLNVNYNYLETILSQYEHSPHMRQLIELFNDGIDNSKQTDNFYVNLFNVSTANSMGLDIWARIVGISRTIEYSGVFPDDSDIIWGFKGSELQNYEHGNFLGIQSQTPRNITVNDAALRTMIMVKAAANITHGSLAELNKSIALLFESTGEGKAFTLSDTGRMKLILVLRFSSSTILKIILQYGNILPIPAGVGIEIREIQPVVFGFNGGGDGVQGFNVACFNH